MLREERVISGNSIRTSSRRDQMIVITYYNDLYTGRTLDLTTTSIKIVGDKVARRAEKWVRKLYCIMSILRYYFFFLRREL